MNKAGFYEQLDDVLNLEPGTVEGDEKLEDFDMWDSLGVVTFIALMDEHLEVTLSPEAISKAETVADLLALVADKLED
ncbi:acyl carrier protein [Desulfuromonas sp. KJ2020]|uniref:acyl carrier protein n=1 Tax=Desulfuromonas sp. KJ2020 TaxID=2919173 RepID=UPI000322F0A2|nr:acyl carrier protein [Desulfuromonas sp. KJ2020]MCP3177559.1 acyl carrier protein [Desulfuromonas sp. KJ2020]